MPPRREPASSARTSIGRRLETRPRGRWARSSEGGGVVGEREGRRHRESLAVRRETVGVANPAVGEVLDRLDRELGVGRERTREAP